MQPARSDISLYRGDDWEQQLQFLDDDGTPYTFPPGEWRSEVRTKPDGELVTELEVQTDKLDEGILTLSLSADNTVEFPAQSVYDLQMVTEEGKTQTYVVGTIQVTKDVTL